MTTLPTSNVKVKEEVQELLVNYLALELNTKPASVQKFFTTNVLGRVLANLVGTDGVSSYLLQCTDGGILRTAGQRMRYSGVYAEKATMSDDDADEWEPDEEADAFTVMTFDYACLFRFNNDGVTWGEWIYLPADSAITIEAEMDEIQIKNAAAGENITYQIISYSYPAAFVAEA